MVGVRIAVIAAVITGFTTTHSSAAPGQKAVGPQIQWRASVEDAARESVQTGKPVLLQFTAEWCGYCHKMFRETFTDPEIVAAVNACVIPVQVDADQHKQLMEEAAISGLPATVILGPDMKIRTKLSGYQSVDKLKIQLAQVCPASGASVTVPTVPVSSPRPAMPVRTADQAAVSAGGPAFRGCCLVSLMDERTLRPGSSEFSLFYKGQLLVFASDRHKRLFSDNMARYWPMLDGKCAVSRVDLDEPVAGDPEFSAIFRGRLWFFGSNENLEEFIDEPTEYVSFQ